jgi:hypothetical protein
MEHLSLKQLKLYPANSLFFVKAIDKSGKVKPMKDLTYDGYEKYLQYLQHLNVNGFNIYFLPPKGGGCGFIDFLLDDLKIDGIQKLTADGLNPFYHLETSPKNFQVILRFNAVLENKEEYLAINRFFVKKYNADLGSIGTEHFFRLAGFTNQKEKYYRNGLYPFVKFYAYAAGNILSADLLPKSFFSTLPNAGRSCGFAIKNNGNNGNCEAYIASIYYSNSNFTDVSRLDFKAACFGLEKGFSEDEVSAAILKYSPNIEIRKAGHISDYLARTVENAAKKTL